MKKRIKKILCIIISIIFIIIGIFIKNQKYNDNKEKNYSSGIDNSISIEENKKSITQNIYNEPETSNTINNNVKIETYTEEKNEDLERNFENTDKKTESTLPDDSGLTIEGIQKTYNQEIMSEANIAYLLGCNTITEETNFKDFIDKHIPQNGIFISERTVYQKTNNPYEKIKERKVMMQEMLSSINLKYNVDKNNYLIDNAGKLELEKKINALIHGEKKIIIGFVADYYTYINDSQYGLHLGGNFTNYSYVSFKPYNDIYAYIYDENSADIDGFYNMLQEISLLAD